VGFFVLLNQQNHISTVSFNLLRGYDGDLKVIALWAFYKSQFVNSVISNYNPNRVVRVRPNIGVTRNTIYKHINILIDNGFAEMRGKHLHLKSKVDMAEEYHDLGKKNTPSYYKIQNIKKQGGNNIKEILLALQAESVLTRYKQINRLPSGGTKISSQQKIQRATPVSISNGQFAKMLNISKSSAQRILNKANGLHYVKYNIPKRRIGTLLSQDEFERLKSKEKGLFVWRGQIWQKFPSLFMPKEEFSYYTMINNINILLNSNNVLTPPPHHREP
jgi:hypothetical protein